MVTTRTDSLRQHPANNATSNGEHDLITIVSPTLMYLTDETKNMETMAPHIPRPCLEAIFEALIFSKVGTFNGRNFAYNYREHC